MKDIFWTTQLKTNRKEVFFASTWIIQISKVHLRVSTHALKYAAKIAIEAVKIVYV